MKYVSAHLVGINVFAAIVPFTKSTNVNNLFVAWLLHKKIYIGIKAIQSFYWLFSGTFSYKNIFIFFKYSILYFILLNKISETIFFT